jgi:protein-disulfide isomerase
VIVLVGGIGYWASSGGAKTSSNYTATSNGGECKAKDTFDITAEDYTLGKADAPVLMVEYASMTCPHCARFSRDVFPLLKEHYIDKGYVRYVFREFPLDRVALTVSVVGRCLPRESYIPFIELMYSEFDTWTQQEELRGSIKEMARRAGMSGDDFEKCLATNTDATKIVERQEQSVKDYCIGGTPTFFIQGKKVGDGEIPWPELDEKLREELKKKGVTVPAAAPAEGAPAPAEGTATPAEGTTPPAEGTATPAEGTPPPPQ